jgi:tripartite-type tricarboxylate transporter receptor subunit TctC
MKNTTRLFAAVASAFVLSAGTAFAQDAYPSRPIRMVVGFPPGGVSDVVARAVANEAANVLGQSIVVENRPGAGTTIASDVVAKSKADGYTLLFQDITTHAINASLYEKLPYDTVKDFTPVAVVSTTPLLLLVNAKSPAKSVKELVGRIHEKPGHYSYGSSGNGTIIHLASELMNKATKSDIVHIPYKGSAALVGGLIAGDLEYVFSSMPPAVSQVQAGTLRGLAVSTPERVAILPDVPTIREAGVPEAEVILYSGVLGPAGMPQDVVQKLNDAFAQALKNKRVIENFHNMGAEPFSVSPAEMAELLQQEIDRYGAVVKEAGVSIN